MTDPTNIMTAQPKVGMNRVLAGAIAGGVASWFLTWSSLHGVDFKTFGVDSEIVKGGITGTLVGVFTAPDTLILGLRDIIIWCYNSVKILRKAAEEGKE